MLDVGSGSGYITGFPVCFCSLANSHSDAAVAAARLLDSRGCHLIHRVIGIDHSPNLVAFSSENFARDSASASPVVVAADRVQA
jgi:hypothetical protein